MDDKVSRIWALRDHQRLVQTGIANRVSNPVIFGIAAVTRIVLVWLNSGDVDHLRRRAGGCFCRL